MKETTIVDNTFFTEEEQRLWEIAEGAGQRDMLKILVTYYYNCLELNKDPNQAAQQTIALLLKYHQVKVTGPNLK